MMQNIKTKVVHSQSKASWNIVGTKLGAKYKIARVPYIVTAHDDINQMNRHEAFEHANFLSFCLNHAEDILGLSFTVKGEVKDLENSKPSIRIPKSQTT